MGLSPSSAFDVLGATWYSRCCPATRKTLGLAPRIQGVSTVTSSSYVHWTVRDGTGQWNSAARTSVRATEDQPKSADDNDASGNTVDELSAHHVLNVGSEFISVPPFAFRQGFVPRVLFDLLLDLVPRSPRTRHNCLLPISPIEHRQRGRNRSEHQNRHFRRRCRCHHCVLYSEQTISVTRSVSSSVTAFVDVEPLFGISACFNTHVRTLT